MAQRVQKNIIGVDVSKNALDLDESYNCFGISYDNHPR